MQALPFELPKFEPGWVWLAGAGPGDAGLLTLHALNALRQADVLVYDALVGKEILDLVSGDCELEYAGKRGGKPSANQRDISLRLVELAEQGKRVLRLKGGDPFVFGRGGEEALALTLNNIPFRVVPGITVGIAGLAYAGIPATHRDFNTSITFISAYGAGGERPNTIDWKSFTNTSQLIVVYMGLQRIRWVCKELIIQGRNKKESIAIISNATYENQKIFITTLEYFAKKVHKEDISSPAILVIGQNVVLSPILNWFKTKEIDYFYEQELLKKKHAEYKSI